MTGEMETRPQDLLAKSMYMNDVYIRRIFNRIETGSLRFHARKIIWNTLYRIACSHNGDNVVSDMLFAAYRMGVNDGYFAKVHEEE